MDFNYLGSKTRRGRVQSQGAICPTITAENCEVYRVEDIKKYRIRKLTPTECFRLMGVKDEDSKKILDTVSNSQAYKQAGNSIVVDVMMAMFKEML